MNFSHETIMYNGLLCILVLVGIVTDIHNRSN